MSEIKRKTNEKRNFSAVRTNNRWQVSAPIVEATITETRTDKFDMHDQIKMFSMKDCTSESKY